MPGQEKTGGARGAEVRGGGARGRRSRRVGAAGGIASSAGAKKRGGAGAQANARSGATGEMVAGGVGRSGDVSSLQQPGRASVQPARKGAPSGRFDAATVGATAQQE